MMDSIIKKITMGDTFTFPFYIGFSNTEVYISHYRHNDKEFLFSYSTKDDGFTTINRNFNYTGISTHFGFERKDLFAQFEILKLSPSYPSLILQLPNFIYESHPDNNIEIAKTQLNEKGYELWIIRKDDEYKAQLFVFYQDHYYSIEMYNPFAKMIEKLEKQVVSKR